MPEANAVKSEVTKLRYKMIDMATCATANCVYVATCMLCNKQYVGETSNALNIRVNNRRADIKRGAATDGAVNHALAHQCPATQELYSYAIIECGFDVDAKRKRMEIFWISQLMADQPYGLTQCPQMLWRYVT